MFPGLLLSHEAVTYLLADDVLEEILAALIVVLFLLFESSHRRWTGARRRPMDMRFFSLVG